MFNLAQVLGTIIASVLNYDELCREIKENPAIDNSKSTYAPCDGRPIQGSQLEIRTNHLIRNAPDLRGKFLRGLNVMYNIGALAPFDPNIHGDPQPNRSVLDYQSDDFAAHNHGGGNHGHGWTGASTIDTWGGNVVVGGNNIGGKGTPPSGDIIHTQGGTDTRPRNIAVYFYIKIN